MKTSRFLTQLLLAVSAVAATTGVFAQSIATDPLVRQLTDRSNWEPGGRYYTFDNRGTITSRSGQINTLVTSNIRAGSVSIQNATIQGTIGFVNSFSNHGWQDHSPFDNVVSRSDSASNQRADGSSTSVSLSWSGTENHPADGYDGPQGGGYPAPGGARDIYSFTVRGTAQGTYLLSTSETQSSDTSRYSGVAGGQNGQSAINSNSACTGCFTTAYDALQGTQWDYLRGERSLAKNNNGFQNSVANSYAEKWNSGLLGKFDIATGPLGPAATEFAKVGYDTLYQQRLNALNALDGYANQAASNGDYLAKYSYLAAKGIVNFQMAGDLIGATLTAYVPEQLGPGASIKTEAKVIANAASVSAKLARELEIYYKSLGATKSLTPIVDDVAVVTKEASIVANSIRGRASETRVLQDMGLTKNTTPVTTLEGKSIPDAYPAGLSVEIKDAANVSLTKQLRIQTEAARAAGRESVLITGEKTCISGACSRAFDTIIRRPDLGPQ